MDRASVLVTAETRAETKRRQPKRIEPKTDQSCGIRGEATRGQCRTGRSTSGIEPQVMLSMVYLLFKQHVGVNDFFRGKRLTL